MNDLKRLTEKFLAQEEEIKKGGGEKGVARQKKLNRLTVRERISHLLDREGRFFEIGLWAGYKMYDQYGGLPAAGVVCVIGTVCKRKVMIIANDATVKAGAMFPQSVKKVLRAQKIAYNCRLPIIYLVDSSGVFLPLQEDIFPDEDDFGRIFRNNSVLSALGIPQIAAIMGNCIAGGGYLPVLCDKLLMTKGSGLYLAGPALVKAAIGQQVSSEELGGSKMHAEISGTVDFEEEDDLSCIKRIRMLVDQLPEDKQEEKDNDKMVDIPSFYRLFDEEEYDIHNLLEMIVDSGSLNEYKPCFGKTLICAFAKINGYSVGIVANQRKHQKTAKGEVELGGVIYGDSADKAARFIMNCNQDRIPIIFFQDVVGFMVGKQAEESGIIRRGAKLVNVVSNCIVPKITVIIGNSFGAGNYALCGKAYDPDFILAWPNAKYAVMGSAQAAETLFHIQTKNKEMKEEEKEKIYQKVKKLYEEQMDIRYGAARGWVDAIIAPHKTKKVLSELIPLVLRRKISNEITFHTGVLQV